MAEFNATVSYLTPFSVPFSRLLPETFMITYLYGLVSIVKELNIMGFGKISRTFWSNTQVRASHCHECK